MVSEQKNFWLNKRVLITGHTGFKGSWLSLWLSFLGANLIGLSLKPEGPKSNFYQSKIPKLMESLIGDIRDLDLLKKTVKKFKPEIIFHLAAQPLVRDSYQDPLSTFNTNVIGTANLLDASRSSKLLKAIVVVTSDKCYENPENKKRFKETDPLGGYDPYSASKACAELVVQSYRKSFFEESDISLATTRAGNVIGGGDWSRDRLIPDLVRAVESGNKVKIRNPKAVRPWQHVLDPLSGYVKLAEKLWDDKSYSTSWNFGPNRRDEKDVEWIVNYFLNKFKSQEIWKLDLENNPHEATYLNLDSQKARDKLDWDPQWDLSRTLDYTYDWYKKSLTTDNMQEFSFKQLNKYLEV